MGRQVQGSTYGLSIHAGVKIVSKMLFAVFAARAIFVVSTGSAREQQHKEINDW